MLSRETVGLKDVVKGESRVRQKAIDDISGRIVIRGFRFIDIFALPKIDGRNDTSMLSLKSSINFVGASIAQ